MSGREYRGRGRGGNGFGGSGEGCAIASVNVMPRFYPPLYGTIRRSRRTLSVAPVRALETADGRGPRAQRANTPGYWAPARLNAGT